MGSRLNKTDLAYIAGFLDGDGSLMMQIKKRSDSKRGNRFMLTICFYQDTRHEKPLFWIRKIFGIGYISRRNDGMTELRIQGFRQVKNVLVNLLPFLKFKKRQAELIIASALLLEKSLENKSKRALVRNILAVQQENYQARRKKSEAELLSLLGLTP